MKKIFLMFAFVATVFVANAQENPSTGDYFDGLTRPLTFNRMIPPHALEVHSVKRYISFFRPLSAMWI